jgi:hypothetical protein
MQTWSRQCATSRRHLCWLLGTKLNSSIWKSLKISVFSLLISVKRVNRNREATCTEFCMLDCYWTPGLPFRCQTRRICKHISFETTYGLAILVLSHSPTLSYLAEHIWCFKSFASGACITIAIRRICDRWLRGGYFPVVPCKKVAACTSQRADVLSAMNSFCEVNICWVWGLRPVPPSGTVRTAVV